MADITSNLEWHDNMYIRKFVKETRVGGEVQSLTIKVKAFKADGIGTVAGDGNMLSYNDHSPTTATVIGKNYKDFDSATVLLEKSMTWSVPEVNRTSVTQSSNQTEYRAKRKTWKGLYEGTDNYNAMWNAFWTDLEALDVSW